LLKVLRQAQKTQVISKGDINMNYEGTNVNIVVADHNQMRLMDLIPSLQMNPQVRVVGIAQTGKDLIERTASMAADAVLIEYSLIDITGIEVAERLKTVSPGTAVFAICDSMSAEFIFKAKNAGIIEIFKRDTFVAREAADRIVSYVMKVRQEWQENVEKYGAVDPGTGPKRERVIKEYVNRNIKQTVVLTYNTKGGVGKSTTAANLAIAIKSSPYMSGQRVALVDFDCGGANISTVCHMPDSDALNRNLAVWENEPENLSAEEVDELMIPGPHGIMVLPAPLNLIQAEKVGYELADKILTLVKRFFDIIVIDGAPNISPPIDSAVMHATHILMIANPEGQSVKQLARTVRLLEPDPKYPDKRDMSYILNKMFVVLNHAQADSKWDLKPNEVSRTIGRPIIAEIPNSDSVKEALHGNSYKQAVELYPDSEYTKAIKKLANDICGAYPEGFNVGGTEQKKEKPKFKLWGK